MSEITTSLVRVEHERYNLRITMPGMPPMFAFTEAVMFSTADLKGLELQKERDWRFLDGRPAPIYKLYARRLDNKEIEIIDVDGAYEVGVRDGGVLKASGLYDTIKLFNITVPDFALGRGRGCLMGWGRDVDLVTGIEYDADKFAV
jgi:hypothetical protein